MRALAIFFLLSWAFIATGAAWWNMQEIRSLRDARDRALAACEASE